MRNSLLISTRAFLLAAALGILYAPQLSAQVRAAVVKNVDEPGRSPYQAAQTSFNNCGVYGWAYFPAVPAGKRLVVTHASGQVNLTTSSRVSARLLSVSSTATSSCAVASGVAFSLLPFFEFSNLVASFAGPTQFYVEEGALPAIFVQSPFDLSVGKQVDFSIQGYLVDKSL